jgi:hypothetical protein
MVEIVKRFSDTRHSISDIGTTMISDMLKSKLISDIKTVFFWMSERNNISINLPVSRLGDFLNSEQAYRINALLKRGANYRFTGNIYNFGGTLLHANCTLFIETFSEKIMAALVIVHAATYTKCERLRKQRLNFVSPLVSRPTNSKEISFYLDFCTLFNSCDKVCHQKKNVFDIERLVTSNMQNNVFRCLQHNFCVRSFRLACLSLLAACKQVSVSMVTGTPISTVKIVTCCRYRLRICRIRTAYRYSKTRFTGPTGITCHSTVPTSGLAETNYLS